MQDARGRRNAVDEVAATAESVRTASEWAAWVYLVVGCTAAIFLALAPPITVGLPSYFVTVAVPSVAVGLIAWAWSQPVAWPARRRLDIWVAGPFLALVVLAAVYRLAAHPAHLDANVVALALLPLVPCLWGALEVRRG